MVAHLCQNFNQMLLYILSMFFITNQVCQNFNQMYFIIQSMFFITNQVCQNFNQMFLLIQSMYFIIQSMYFIIQSMFFYYQPNYSFSVNQTVSISTKPGQPNMVNEIQHSENLSGLLIYQHYNDTISIISLNKRETPFCMFFHSHLAILLLFCYRKATALINL